MISLLYLLFVTFLFFQSIAKEQHVKVLLADGSPIIGKTFSEQNVEIAEFIGIPYAEPPVGNLRFMPPVEKVAWTEPLSCLGPAVACMQKSAPGPKKTYLFMTEDSLQLNIWAPLNATRSTPLNVIVFIHGGAFQFGAAGMEPYNASVLVARHYVLVVSMNHRLGILGFLAVANTDILGNQGLFDQVEALKWIQRNIKMFGGGSNKVTLFGASAGAASAGHHILSPYSKGLFQRAILQSGVPNCPWGLMSTTEAHRRSRLLIDALDCETPSAGADKRCLQEANATAMIFADLVLNDYTFMSFYPNFDHNFFPDLPLKLVRDGKIKKVDVIVGGNEKEGNLFLPIEWPDLLRLSDNLENPNFMTSLKLWEQGMNICRPPTIHRGSLADRALKHEYSRWKEPITPKMRLDT